MSSNHSFLRASYKVMAGAILLVSVAAQAATHSVTNGNDAGAGSYRQAVIDGNGDGNPVIINFNAGLTINLTSGDVVYTNTQPITLNGNGSAIDGGDLYQILDASGSNPAVTVNDLTMRDGATAGNGGAIETSTDVTINNSTFTGNNADNDGGAIGSSSGPITISDSVFTDNMAVNNGGAVRVSSGSVVAIRSTFRNNTAGGDGGVIRGSSTEFTVTGSTFEGNTAGQEGGVIRGSSSNLTATNSTFAGNTAVDSGGVLATFSGAATLTNVTSTSNGATNGAHFNVDTLIAFGTVLADPVGGSVCLVTTATTSIGYNYDTDGSCGFGSGPGDVSAGADPLLGALASNGGPTETQMPLSGSPLIDAIGVGSCDPDVDADQRGVERPQQGNPNTPLGCDIGAVEVSGEFAIPTLTLWGLLLLASVLTAGSLIRLR